MTIFYSVMGLVIVGTLLPSMVLWLMYAFGGNHAHREKAQTLWNVTRVVALFGFNLLIWGHVVVGLWQLKFG